MYASAVAVASSSWEEAGTVPLGRVRYGHAQCNAIRNPISHTQDDLDEDEALEQLAALSVLAR